VPYRVSFSCPVGRVPTAVLDRVRSRLREISHTLAAVFSSDSFWSSIAENPLYVDLDGWRFTYSIDRSGPQFVVLQAVPISEMPGAAAPSSPVFKKQA
jgi:hypothetical protein